MSNSQILGEQAGLLVRYEWMQEDALRNEKGCLMCLTRPSAAGQMATTSPGEIRIIESSNGGSSPDDVICNIIKLTAD